MLGYARKYSLNEFVHDLGAPATIKFGGVIASLSKKPVYLFHNIL